MDKFNVFSINRFALKDGQGIRSTIFFKGCPLRCRWCHNPEGLETKRQVLYLKKKCIHCGACWHTAKHGGVSEGPIVHREIEEDWQAIVDACPTGALCWDSQLYTLEQLVQEAKKDAPFFRYGGGITLSGGEPLNQQEKLVHLIDALHQEGLHVTIETSLMASLALVKQVIERIDMMYCDCKMVDHKSHQQATGVDNQTILENIRYVVTHYPKKVIVRTPLIPGYTSEHVEKIAQFLASINPEVCYELLNYNVMADIKYEYVDLPFGLAHDLKAYTKEEMETFVRVAKKYLKHVQFQL